MNVELNALKSNGTFEIINEVPKSTDIIKSKWVFKNKVNLDGTIKRKSRLVACGYSQIHGVNYDQMQIFAPTLKLKSLKLLLAIANDLDYECHHMDISNAFLNAELKEKIYLKLPSGLNELSKKTVRLKRTLYGLKQAPNSWFHCFTNYIINNLKFNRIKSDECILKKLSSNKIIILFAIYVDDIVLIFNKVDVCEIKKLKCDLLNQFKGKDLSDIQQILGIKITRNRSIKQLKSQKEYIEKILKRFKMEDCNGAFTPCATSLPNVPNQSEVNNSYHMKR